MAAEIGRALDNWSRIALGFFEFGTAREIGIIGTVEEFNEFGSGELGKANSKPGELSDKMISFWMEMVFGFFDNIADGEGEFFAA